MALDPSILSLLMQSTFGIFTPGAKDEFDCYAEGVVQGLKTGIVTVTTTGVGGTPGQGQFLGAIQGGPLVMAGLVATNAIGVMPPLPEGLPTPLQALWYLAIGQIATHVLTALQVNTTPSDTVSTGVGIVTPGGFTILGPTIAQLIIAAFLKKGLTPTPRRIQIAQVVGISTQQMMALATMTIPIIGGAPTAPPSPMVGVRTGTIS
jgi:hypothetical protein